MNGRRPRAPIGRRIVPVLIAGLALGCRPAPPEPALLALAERFIEAEPGSFLDRTSLLAEEVTGRWSFQHPEDVEAWRPRGFDKKLELRGEELVLHSTKRRPRLRREVDWQASSIDAVVAEVPGFARGVGRLFWAGEGEELSEERSVGGRLVDEAFPLRLVFDPLFHPRWRGRIRRVAIELYSPENVEFRLRAIRTVRYRPMAQRVEAAVARPWKIDLDHEVRGGLLALPGGAVSWEVEIPPAAVLRLGYAADTGARQAIGFAGRLEIEDGGREALFDAVVDPVEPPAAGRWHDLEVDLSAFAGRRATLRLSVRAAEGEYDLTRGFAFWSGPEILSRSPASLPPNVVVISVDTLRADHLPLYGYDRATAPSLEAWARRRAVTFKSAVAASPWTVPSHVSMFSGLDALRHGVNHPGPIPGRLELLAERFRDAGYGTLAVTGGGFMRPQAGFVQGFDRYRYWPDAKSEDELDDGVERALEWIDAFEDRGFLLFFHTFEVHYPFRRREPHFSRLAGAEAAGRPEIHIGLNNAPTAAPEGFELTRQFFWKPEKKVLERSPVSATELSEIVDRYDSGIAYMDERIGRLLARLEEGGLDRRTVVVVTSDHGEALGERGLAGHAYLDDFNLLIPLLIAAPGTSGGAVVETQVRTVDLLPTLAELAGLPATVVDGASLVPLLEGRPAEHPRVAWSYAGFSNRGLSLRFDNRLKYRYNNAAWAPLQGREQFYDLLQDPGEEHDLAAGRDTSALRRQARSVLDQAAGLEVRFANASDLALSGWLRGVGVHPTTVKAAGLPEGAITWRDVGILDFRVEPGEDFQLLLERIDGRTLRFAGGFEVPGARAAAFREILRLADVGDGWRLTHSAGGWVAVSSEASPESAPESATGIFVRWRGGDGVSPEGSQHAVDAGLAEQLRALGYVP